MSSFLINAVLSPEFYSLNLRHTSVKSSVGGGGETVKKRLTTSSKNHRTEEETNLNDGRIIRTNQA